MTTETTKEHVGLFSNGVRVAFGVSGIVAVVLGILILVAPMKTASIITAIIALYAIVSGVIYASIGIFSKKIDGWKRIGNGVLGVLFIVVGIIAFLNLNGTTSVIATIVALMIGIAWIVEGIAALMMLKDAASRVWAVVYAAISVIAGVVVIFAPFTFAALLWLVLGISLVVLGIIQIVRGFSFKADKFIVGA